MLSLDTRSQSADRKPMIFNEPKSDFSVLSFKLSIYLNKVNGFPLKKQTRGLIQYIVKKSESLPIVIPRYIFPASGRSMC